MFLDSELAEIQAAKARLATRCDLRRQVVLLEVQSAWTGLKRKIGYASMGLSIGLAVTEIVRSLRRRRQA